MPSNLPPGYTQEELDNDEREDIRRITDDAIDQGYRGADISWKDMALECVRMVCLKKERFTTNDVRWLIEASPIKTHDKRAMGGVMKHAQKIGWICRTGESIMSRVGHGVPLQVWRSRIYKATLFP